MQPIIETRRDEIARLCRRFHVRRMDLFGSATQADFDPSTSDVDFLVEFEPDGALKALHQYFGLKEALEALLERPVDPVRGVSGEKPLHPEKHRREPGNPLGGVTPKRTSGTPATRPRTEPSLVRCWT